MSDTPPIKLYTALLAAMRDFGTVKKDRQNPAFRSSYATLHSILEAVEGPLNDHGLILMQRLAIAEDGAGMALMTELIHAESGEREGSVVPIVCAEPSNPQKVGSAITYMRRYSLLTLLNLTPEEDDDGNAASKPAPRATSAPHSNGTTPTRAQTPSPPQGGSQALTTQAFDDAISAAWDAFEGGKIYETAVMGLNAVRARFSEEQRAIALDEVSKLREAYRERDAALAAPAFASVAG